MDEKNLKEIEIEKREEEIWQEMELEDWEEEKRIEAENDWLWEQIAIKKYEEGNKRNKNN